MSFKEKVGKIIKNKRTTWRLIHWVAYIIVLDVIITIYELTFIEGSSEKNPIASYLIQEFGIVPGLIISVMVEIIVIASFYILLKKLLPGIQTNNQEDWVMILNGLWIVFLLTAFILHLKAVVHNLWILLISF